MESATRSNPDESNVDDHHRRLIEVNAIIGTLGVPFGAVALSAPPSDGRDWAMVLFLVCAGLAVTTLAMAYWLVLTAQRPWPLLRRLDRIPPEPTWCGVLAIMQTLCWLCMLAAWLIG